MSEPHAEPLIWYHRIGFRLGVGLAALLLLAYVLFPYVHDFSLRLFGLPGIHKNLVRWSAENPPTGALEEIGRARLLPREDMIFVTHYLLQGAVHEAPGRWRPEPQRIVTLDRVLAADGQSYAWLDADRRVLFASPGLPVAEGDTLDVSLAEEGSSLGQTHDGVALGRLAAGVWKEGEFAGWLLVYPQPPGPRRELLVSESDKGGPIVVGDDVLLPGSQFESTVRWSDRVLNAASILSFGGLALLLSLAVSRMITRRVTSLANLAAKPVNDPRDLPGPFDESGHDEIATLARTMNGMRARVLKLVEDLDRRDRDRRRWIAQVSHDLRTPLTALIACLERAEATLDSEGPEAVRERLTVARMDAARLNVLTEDLLDIARLETEEAPVREPVPPGELVRQAARAMSGLAELHGVELEPEVEPELPLLNADGKRLMRGLENLLRNALHHAKSRVTVAARHGNGGVVFEVRDDGAGLPLENDGSVDIAGLATHLSREDSSGLGLVVVRKVAEAHGGSMGARNCEGGGALVWFAVPR